ncbi:MAG: hypothetical protein U0Y10_23015 [Spirosomataceae bacterium]
MEEPLRNRPPRRKLGFGDMFGLGNRGEQTVTAPSTQRRDFQEGNQWVRRLTPWIVLLGAALLAIDLFRDKGNPRTTYRTGAQVLDMEWKGTILKKYADINGKTTHPILEIKDLADTAAVRQIIDFEYEKTHFWDRVEVKDKIEKRKGSLSVRIHNYTRDTTFAMEFEK